MSIDFFYHTFLLCRFSKKSSGKAKIEAYYSNWSDLQLVNHIMLNNTVVFANPFDHLFFLYIASNSMQVLFFVSL